MKRYLPWWPVAVSVVTVVSLAGRTLQRVDQLAQDVRDLRTEVREIRGALPGVGGRATMDNDGDRTANVGIRQSAQAGRAGGVGASGP